MVCRNRGIKPLLQFVFNAPEIFTPKSHRKRGPSSPIRPAPLDGAAVSHTSLPQRASHFRQHPFSVRPTGPGGGVFVGGDGAGARNPDNESDRACLAASRFPRPQSRLRGDAFFSGHDRAPDGGQRTVDRLAASGRGRAPQRGVRPPGAGLPPAAGVRTAAAGLSSRLSLFSSR